VIPGVSFLPISCKVNDVKLVVALEVMLNVFPVPIADIQLLEAVTRIALSLRIILTHILLSCSFMLSRFVVISVVAHDLMFDSYDGGCGRHSNGLIRSYLMSSTSVWR
jgi:hypothetical protein